MRANTLQTTDRVHCLIRTSSRETSGCIRLLQDLISIAEDHRDGIFCASLLGLDVHANCTFTPLYILMHEMRRKSYHHFFWTCNHAP